MSADIFARARITSPVAAAPQPPSLPGGWSALTIQGRAGVLKVVLALLAAVVWIGGAWWGKRKQRRYGSVTVLLGLLAVCALFNWLNWFRFHGPGYHYRAVHVHEFYHYYIGSKYFRELRYDQLYLCTVAADLERGDDRFVKRGWVRNLQTYESERVAAVEAGAARCRQRFSEQRWAEFQKDLDWFRGQPWLDTHVLPDADERFMVDHGYNASPVWGILGTGLASLAGAALAAATLLPLSVFMGGTSCWPEFAENLTAHVRIGTVSPNVLGLRSATASLSTGYSPLLFAAAVAVSLLALWGIRLRPPWLVAPLMVALLPFWIGAASYYYVVFLVLAMLGSRVQGVTPLLLLASALTSVVPLISGRIGGSSYVAAIVILAVLSATTVLLSRLEGRREQPQRAAAGP